MTNILANKKLLLGLMGGLVCFFAVFLIGRVFVVNGMRTDGVSGVKKIGGTSKEGSPSVFKAIAKPIFLSPKTITFKEKTLQVEEVGVEEGGILGVPKSWQTTGWYKDGAKPGEEGNVVIDGHYDTNTGAPGAFWELKDLQVGDKVVLTDLLGREFDYKVTEKSSIGITDPDRAKVFSSSKQKELTLITCGGVWDYASGTYNKRLVIKAEFDKMEKAW